MTGQVIKARHVESGALVAIKLILNPLKHPNLAKQYIGEIQILRKLSKVKNNCFTSRLYDVIAPGLDGSTGSDMIKSCQSDGGLSHLFLVMEYIESDFQKLLDHTEAENLSEEHLTHLLYNLICSVKFVHSAGLMHRDIKPANILVDSNCHVRVCDFGMAKTISG